MNGLLNGTISETGRCLLSPCSKRGLAVAYPESSVFLKIIFFDRYEKEISNQVERSESMIFTYPNEAYSYKVQLLSAGVESLEFHCLNIDQIIEESDD